ncbi:MAG: monovalent cation/H(+) antiporter subunit G [Phycisphaerales bacterium]|nr:monovalent cation/H(+) antiporter subunit G [Phycisphaerales bacterium]
MMPWQLWVAGALAVLGCTFSLLGALGILVMTDVFIRMHAASKAATLGAACLLMAAAVGFWEVDVAFRTLAVIVFVFLTAPVAAHVIGRAAYLSRVDLAPETVMDELADKYDLEAGVLRGEDKASPERLTRGAGDDRSTPAAG